MVLRFSSMSSDLAGSRATEVARAAHGWLSGERRRLLSDLRRLVELETPTGDCAQLTAAAEWLTEWFAPLGRVRQVVTERGAAPHVLVEAGPVADGSLLVLCHYDTVWPAGTRSRWQFAATGTHASGPGVLDMKASIVLVHHAQRALQRQGMSPSTGVRILLSADEERGNPTSRGLIEDLARQATAALVLEPPLADGTLKTSRKGYARIRVEIAGRGAHAGIAPEQGVNAAVEAAHAALFADGLNDFGAGTSVTVGILRSGHQSNVVPSSANVELDIRAPDDREMQRVLKALRRLSPRLDGSRLSVHLDLLRAPMPRVAATDALLASARGVGDALGIPIHEGHTGGVSEGNLTQAVGTPTLDGLGVVGVGAHTRDERIEVQSLVDRTALHAGMLVDLAASRV